MGESISVGSISLDLIIKDKLTEQLDKIKARVSTPAAKVGELVQESIAKPMEQAGKNISKSIGNAIKQTEAAIGNGIDEAITKATKRMEEQNKAFENVATKAASIEFDMPKSDKISQNIKKPIEEAVEESKKKLNEFSSFEAAGDPVGRLTQKIETSYEKLSLLQKKWQELSNAGSDDKIASQLNAIERQIISTEEQLEKYQAQIKKYQEEISKPIAFDFELPQVPKIPEPEPPKFNKLKSASSSAFSSIKKVGTKAFNGLKAAGSNALNSLGNGFKKLGSSASSLTKPLKKLSSTLKSTFKRVFIAASLYAAFRAIKDGLFDVIKADEAFNKSLNEVKANLAIAFTPIMQAIMPALNAMVSGLAAVTKQVAAFISGLFGKTYKESAEATKKLKSLTDAAKKAKLATAGIDEMNILSGDDEEKSSGTDYSKLDMSEPELPDWAEKLKEKLRSGDWAGVGGMLANGINKALSSIDWDKVSSKVNTGVGKIADGINGFLDNIDWDTLGDTLAGGLNTLSGAILTFNSRVNWDKLGAGIAQGLNRAIKKTNWKQLGKSLGSIVQSIISAAYSFALNFDWSGFGNAIGDTINGWFEAVDFAKAGQTLSLGIIGVLKTASAALDRTDFVGIGRKVSDALNNIDIVGIAGEFAHTLSSIISGALDLAVGLVEKTKWGKLPGKLFDSLGAMLRNIDWGGLVSKAFRLAGAAVGAKLALAVGLVRKVWDIIVSAYNSVKNYFSSKIEECGGNVVAGIFSGILDAFKNVGSWIYDHIFKPFITGFKNAFGIASPSKVMAEMGGYLIDGLYNAVAGGIKRITEIFGKVVDAVKKPFDGIGSWFSSTFSGAWSNVKSAFTNAGSFFGEVWNGIKGAFGNVAEWFGNTFSEAWTKVKEVFSKGGEVFKGISEGIYNTFKTIVDYLIDGINKVVSVPFKAINDVLQKLKDVKIGKGKLSVEPFKWMPTIDIPEIPHLPALAQGGLATAPTLAMVGDNRNAQVDPEVISPLSKLQGLIGADPEIVELLRIIVELLRSGMNIEIINYMFRNSKEFSREVIKAVADDNARRGR